MKRVVRASEIVQLLRRHLTVVSNVSASFGHTWPRQKMRWHAAHCATTLVSKSRSATSLKQAAHLGCLPFGTNVLWRAVPPKRFSGNRRV
jgi:hypothetical protein